MISKFRLRGVLFLEDQAIRICEFKERVRRIRYEFIGKGVEVVDKNMKLECMRRPRFVQDCRQIDYGCEFCRWFLSLLSSFTGQCFVSNAPFYIQRHFSWNSRSPLHLLWPIRFVLDCRQIDYGCEFCRWFLSHLSSFTGQYFVSVSLFYIQSHFSWNSRSPLQLLQFRFDRIIVI